MAVITIKMLEAVIGLLGLGLVCLSLVVLKLVAEVAELQAETDTNTDAVIRMAKRVKERWIF